MIQACNKCGGALPPCGPVGGERTRCSCGAWYEARLGVVTVAERVTWPGHSVKVLTWVPCEGPKDFPAEVCDPSGLPKGGG